MIAAIAIGAAVAVALLVDAFALPRGDDWAYRKIALDFARAHHFHLAGWNDVTLLGQIVAAQPFLALFGKTNATLSGFGVVAAFSAVALTYALAHELLVCARALLVIGILVVFPSFALLSTSFMTDTCAFGAEMGCLFLGLKAIRSKKGLALLLSAVAVGFFGFTVREFAVAAPVAVLAAYGLRRFPPAPSVIAVAGAFALGAGAFYVWRQSLQSPVHQVALEQPGNAMSVLGQAFFTLGLGCLPVTAVMATRLRPRRGQMWVGLLAAATAAAVGLALQKQSHLLLGATITRTGADWEGLLAGKQETLFPAPVWSIIVAVALGSGCLLAYALTIVGTSGALSAWSQDNGRRLLLLFGLAQTGLLVLRAATGGGIEDRYVWPLLVVLLVLLLDFLPESRSHQVRVNRLALVGPVAFLAVLSAVTLVDSYSFAAARWHLAQSAVSGGARPDEVDAGFEWVGTYYAGTANEQGLQPRSSQPRGIYLVRLFPRTRNCYVVSSEHFGEHLLYLIAAAGYRPYGVAGRSRLFLYRNDTLCPPAHDGAANETALKPLAK